MQKYFADKGNRGNVEGDLNNSLDVTHAAQLIADGHSVVIDNDAVFGIWGDATQPSYAEEIGLLKGRDPSRPHGLTVPFEQIIPYADVDAMPESLQPLITDNELSSRLGALAFIRLLADEEALKNSGLSANAQYRDADGKLWVQTWSPNGKSNMERLFDAARNAGVEYLAATSLNVSGKVEIVDPIEAAAFVRQCSEVAIPVLIDTAAQRRGTGSYPILSVDEDGLQLRRNGNLSVDILRSLLEGFELIEANEIEECWHQPLNINDDPEFAHLSASELRDRIIQFRGWQ